MTADTRFVPPGVAAFAELADPGFNVPDFALRGSVRGCRKREEPRR
jgi:hypothetical protein